MYIDKEYALLESLSEKESVSQRRLSQILNISLGSVNMLISKMQRDGLIKIKSISHNRVIYMLTPEGIAEKTNKAIRYMVRNYRYINDMKEKVKTYLQSKLELESKLYLLVDDTEISQIVLLAANEIDSSDRLIVVKEIPADIEDVLVLMAESRKDLKNEKIRMEVVWEKI